MTEDERIDEKGAAAEEADDVEAHGAKHVVAAGLAGAALIGAGAAGVKLATDDDASRRNVGALTSREAADLKAADRDGDGYLTYRELADIGMKMNVALLRDDGYEITAEGLSAAGGKLPIESVGEGYPIEGESIMVKLGVTDELDRLLDGPAQEWTNKLREIDLDNDGYVAPNDLEAAGNKYDLEALRNAGVKIEITDLLEAGYEAPVDVLGEGGFMIKGESVMLRYGVDSKFDALVAERAWWAGEHPVGQVVDRFLNDPKFEEELRADPKGAVERHGFDLSEQQVAALEEFDWSASDEQLLAKLSERQSC